MTTPNAAAPVSPVHKDGPAPEELWNAVISRDRSFDGRFVYAVRSTGVYCRPTCPSRRPGQEQVRYFAGPEEAANAGYRACRRCLPNRLECNRQWTDAELAQAVCNHIDAHLEEGSGLPRLQEVSEKMKVSPSYLQRVFRRITGFTPTQYSRGKRMERFKGLVRKGASVSDSLYEAGYGSSSRLYEQASHQLGMTPASYRKGGAGAVIRYIITESALGGLVVAGTSKGVCAVKLGDDANALVSELEQEFPAADMRAVAGVFTGTGDKGDGETDGLRRWTSAVLECLAGRSMDIDLPLDVQATLFQWRVWRQLQAIPAGETRTYQQLAKELEQPGASRAVGRACATNPVAPIIPCHRALRKDGGLGGYRWGLHRKEALLDMERSHSSGTAPQF